MAEIVQKHRDSGHYDDPQYRVEEWLQNVLPNIRPGFSYDWGKHRGLHFFDAYQIWPSVRVWLPEELGEIPQTLWPYLAINSS